MAEYGIYTEGDTDWPWEFHGNAEDWERFTMALLMAEQDDDAEDA